MQVDEYFRFIAQCDIVAQVHGFSKEDAFSSFLGWGRMRRGGSSNT